MNYQQITRKIKLEKRSILTEKTDIFSKLKNLFHSVNPEQPEKEHSVPLYLISGRTKKHKFPIVCAYYKSLELIKIIYWNWIEMHYLLPRINYFQKRLLSGHGQKNIAVIECRNSHIK